MANITLKIDDRLLENARHLASQQKTSINAIIRETLERFVSSDQSREASLRGLDAFFLRCHARVGPKTWTRDELHER